MLVKAVGSTDTGRVRPQNQDAFLIDDELQLYIVCDGMGGHAAGDVASTNATQMSADTVREFCRDIPELLAKPGGHFRVVQRVIDAVRVTCQVLHNMAVQEPEYQGMGTTLTMLLIVGNKGILAHVGDSRLYLLRDGDLHQLSTDHTLANELILTGQIKADSEEARKFGHVLTRSVGPHEYVDVETLLFDLLPDDRFLLCSDGLSNYFVDNDEITRQLSHDALAEVPTHLAELANSRGGKDNITSIVLHCLGDDGESDVGAQQRLDAVGHTFLAKGLSLSRRMRLANTGSERRFGVDETIVCRGKKLKGMDIVIEGQCRMQLPDGRTVSVGPGECFGELGLVQGVPARIQVTGTEPGRLLHLPRIAFRSLVRRVPKLGRRLLNNLVDQIASKYDDVLKQCDSLSDTAELSLDSETQK